MTDPQQITTDSPMGGASSSKLSTLLSRRRPSVGVVLLLLVSYVPLLLTKPGKVGADTKTYLYLDPGKLLSRAAFMWDPNIGLGTVTHQNIGYLWPMGPYYFVMDAIGIPDWVAQRLWLGSIILAAGLGVRWMLKELRWESAGVTIAAFAYSLSPYILDYAARISVILLPFAGLPWLIGLASRSLRQQTWRAPAVFALVTLTVGGVNATSLLLVMFGPILWFVHATFVLHEVKFRDALRAGLRITALTAVTSLWWIAGLSLQGGFGIPILRYTETYEVVAAAAFAPDLLRGLGYWFFYGRDGIGAWTASSVAMVESLFFLWLSYLIPGLALLAGLLTRWRNRVFFASIVVVGLVLSIGAHPWNSPTPYGAVFKAWTHSDMGLSFRSTPRAVPLIALGLAVFLGAGVAAVTSLRPRLGTAFAGGLLVLVCLNQIALFRGQMVDRNLLRDEDLPSYRVQAAKALSAGDPDTRALEFPGIDFAAYRWGNTVDPVTPGLTDRQYVARELIPYGSPPSADLLNSMDEPFQSGRADPGSLAPLARLMGIGDIMFRADLQYERYLTPRPRVTWTQLLGAPGLSEPQTFGHVSPNEPSPEMPTDDERQYAIPSDAPDPPPVSIFPVENPRPILRTVSGSDPVLVAGNGSGLVSMASSGMLQVDRPNFYAASFAGDSERLDSLLDGGAADLVVTDTNRRQGRRWGTVRDNDGYTERAGEKPLKEDLGDNRLDIFPGSTDDSRTIAEQVGGATVSASRYGNGVSFTAGDRAVNAMDGNLGTAWRVAAFDEAKGEFLQIDLRRPVKTDHINLIQEQGGKNRHMTSVKLTFDGNTEVTIGLREESKTSPGQILRFPERSFKSLRITVASTDHDSLASFKGISDVGIAEVSIPGVDPVHEVIRPPVDLLEAAGSASIDHALSYVFARRASNQHDVLAADEEPSMSRWLIGPIARSFTPFGKARLAVNRPDPEIDRTLGLADATQGGVTASSSASMLGTATGRARLAVDGDSSTAYSTPINLPYQAITFTYPEPITINSLPMVVVADGKHSVPTHVTISADGRPGVGVELAESGIGEGNSRGATKKLTVDTGTITGSTFTLKIDAVTAARSKDRYSDNSLVLPVAIAEVGLPPVALPPANTLLSDACRSDLLSIDGKPVPLRIKGTVAQAAAGENLEIQACGSTPTVPAGKTLLQTGNGAVTGIDVDLLALSSAPGGSAGIDSIAVPLDDGEAGPSTSTERTGRNSYDVSVESAEAPYWIVLGESFNAGWTARTSSGKDLGEPTLINGFANAWRIDPSEIGSTVTVNITWKPQRIVWIGIVASLLGVLVCIGLIFVRPRKASKALSDSSNAERQEVLRSSTIVRGVSPRSQSGVPLAWRRSLLWSASVGVAAVVFGGPFVGLTTAVAMLVATRLRRGQPVLRLACLGLYGASAGYIVLKQALASYELDFRWVSHFEVTHAWAVCAVFLLVVSVIADSLRRRAD